MPILLSQFDLRTPSPMNLFSCISFSGSGLPVQLKCVVLDPMDRNCFAIGGFDQFVRLFDIRMYQWDASTCINRPVTTYCPRHLLDSLDNHITGLAYSNKSELLVSYDCEQIYLFDKGMDIGPDPMTVSEEHLLNLVQPRGYGGHRNTLPVKPVCFLGQREEYIVSGSECSNIFVWRKKDSKLLRKMVAGPSSVQVVATYPNTLFFASGGHDRKVRVWAPIGEEPERDPEPVNSSNSSVQYIYFIKHPLIILHIICTHRKWALQRNVESSCMTCIISWHRHADASSSTSTEVNQLCYRQIKHRLLIMFAIEHCSFFEFQQ